VSIQGADNGGDSDAGIDRRALFQRAGVLGLTLSSTGGLLSACDLGDGDDGGNTTPRKGGTLRVGPSWDITSIDPAQNGSGSRGWHPDGVFEGLTTYVAGTKWEVTNALAEKLDVSSDGRRIAFTLKQGIEFHGGYGELTAEDVKYSIERIAGRVKLFPGAKKSDVSLYESDWAALDRIKVTGKHSGEILLTEPSAVLVNLTLPWASSGLVTSKTAVEKLGRKFQRAPIGSGPYQVASYTPGKELVLEPFAGYGGASGRPVGWDEIRFLIDVKASQGNASTVLLEAGDVDFVPLIGARDFARLEGTDDFSVYRSSTLSYVWMSLNVQHPKLSDIKVRQAIRYAVDVPALMALAEVPPKQRADALISRELGIGHWEDAPRYERDLDQARSLLSEAGVESLELDLVAEPEGSGELIQANLAEIGIKVKIIQTAPDNWYTDKTVAQLTYSQFSGAPDLTYQTTWFNCENVEVFNYSFWCDENYDRLFRRLSVERNPEKRGTIAIEMQKIMDQSAAFIWAYYPSFFFAGRTGIEPVFDPSGVPYFTRFRTV
jgi:peptide/nickel transport system substrate-binding protein